MNDPLHPPPSEEERRRKIIIDSQVSRAAGRGIRALMNDELSAKQVRDLTALDQEYLERLREIAPDLVPED